MVDPSKLSELFITAVDSTVRKLQLIQISTNERFIRKKATHIKASFVCVYQTN